MPHAPSVEHGERLSIQRPGGVAAADDFAGDVRRGLAAERKSLPPKYFYDELGSQLFEAICLLPEYYLTRAEAEIFARRSAEIVARAAANARVTLFELGSGSATKTRRIVEALVARQRELTYVPVDISPAALEAGAQALLREFEGLNVSAYASDYDAALPLLSGELREGERALVLFLGSNVGDFDREGAGGFLSKGRRGLRAGDGL